MQSRLTTTAAAALAAAALMTAAAKAEPIVLKVSHPFADQVEFIQAMTDEFNATHTDVKVEYVVGGDNWEPLFQSTLRNAVVDKLPDVTHQLTNYVGPLVSRGIVQPLDAIPGGKELLASTGIPAVMVSGAALDGHTYAIPFGTTIPVVYYNMTLLKKAGWDKDHAPATWAEIDEAAAKVAALGGNNNGGFFEHEASNNFMFQNVLSSLGGQMAKPDGSVGFDDAAGLAAMQALSDFGKASATPEMTRDQARQAFNAGLSAMLFRSASGIPSIMKAAQENGFELAVGNWPVESADGHLSAITHGIFILTKDPARQAAAMEYLDWASGDVGQSILATKAGYLPVNAKAVATSNRFTAYFEANPYARQLIDSLAKAKDWFTYPVDNAGEIFNAQIEIARRVIWEGLPPADAVAEMKTETESLLGQ